MLAANSVNGYRGRDVAPLAVANDLAVRYVLEGSVRRVAEDLRINVRLIDSREGKNAWAQSYEGPITDVFKFQDNMVENIVSSLAIKVSEAERGRVLARETASVPAYEAFRRGQAALLLKTPENLPVALAAFREAITIDPALQPGLCRHGAGLLERLGLGLGVEPQRDRGHRARHRPAISRAGRWNGRPRPPTSSPPTSISTPGNSTIRSISRGLRSSSRRATRRATWSWPRR